MRYGMLWFTLRGINQNTVYFYLKLFMIINFLLCVYLSTNFRVGLAMFAMLFIELLYFWRSHSQFVTVAEKEYLDNKILKSMFHVNHRTKSFLQDLCF